MNSGNENRINAKKGVCIHVYYINVCDSDEPYLRIGILVTSAAYNARGKLGNPPFIALCCGDVGYDANK